jgi:hypothetical protein
VNYFDQIQQALREHREAQSAIQRSAQSMALLLAGNLHHCYPAVLKRLKDELRNYNVHTGKWKGE